LERRQAAHTKCRIAKWLGALLVATLAMSSAHTKTPDVRIIIDVSGSMKKTDPKNLRIPALRLLVDLVPEGARAGVWTFGKFVNMQVPLGPVSSAWRKRALAQSAKIHSRGLFTDIESALTRGAKEWEQPSTTYDRHVILLTDGVVDVPDGEQASNASRSLIVERVLPKLESVGAKVHTVGLSEHADTELLKQLSAATQGQFMEVSDPSTLQRVFLRLFEQTTPRDAVPLVDNQFTVDPSVKELTLVVFRAEEDSRATTVFSPEGASFDAAETPDNVRWRSDEGYDLVTIEQPEAGRWRIDAKVDPDNRVMVITDLKLQTSELPAFALPGDVIPLTAQLTDKGEPVTRQSFLETLSFLVTPIPTDTGSALPDPIELEAGTEGVYQLEDLATDMTPGIFDVVTRVDGGTFVRERRHRLNIQWPISAALETVTGEDPADPAKTELVVTTAEGIVQPENVAVAAKLIAPSGEEIPLELTPAENRELRAPVPTRREPGEHQLHVRALGETISGRPFDASLEPLAVAGLPKPETKPEPEPEPEPEPAVVEQVAQEGPPPPNWLVTCLSVGGINLLAAALAFGLWYWRRERAKAELDQLLGAV